MYMCRGNDRSRLKIIIISYVISWLYFILDLHFSKSNYTYYICMYVLAAFKGGFVGSFSVFMYPRIQRGGKVMVFNFLGLPALIFSNA